MSGATATPYGLAAVSSSSATAWASHQNTPRPGAQQYNGVAESAIQRCDKLGMASRRSALRRLGPEGFLCIKAMDPRGDRLWAESAKDAAQKLNQSASPSSPGRASPQELFTKTKGPFRVLPFLQEGFMSVTPLNKLENRAV